MKKILIIAVILISCIKLSGQESDKYEITDFFKLVFYENDDGTYGFYDTQDSLKLNDELFKYSSVMLHFNEYLFKHYSGFTRKFEDSLVSLLPDTNLIHFEFNRFLKNNDRLNELLASAIGREKKSEISIEEIQNILARFRYIHRIGDLIVVHNCIGKNEVLNLEQTEFTPYYNAFCWMLNRTSDKIGIAMDKLLYPVNVKDDVTDIELENVKNNMYAKLANSKEVKELIIEEYESKKEFLNFKILY